MNTGRLLLDQRKKIWINSGFMVTVIFAGTLQLCLIIGSFSVILMVIVALTGLYLAANYYIVGQRPFPLLKKISGHNCVYNTQTEKVEVIFPANTYITYIEYCKLSKRKKYSQVLVKLPPDFSILRILSVLIANFRFEIEFFIQNEINPSDLGDLGRIIKFFGLEVCDPKLPEHIKDRLEEWALNFSLTTEGKNELEFRKNFKDILIRELGTYFSKETPLRIESARIVPHDTEVKP